MSDNRLDPQLEHTAFLTTIGHICVQWALLEQTAIAIIACAESLTLEKVYARYGTLDMLPRLNMAIKLTQEARWPQRLIKPLFDIRKAVQRGGGGIADRRNLFIHGVHEQTDTPNEFLLTMVRWSPDKRKTRVTALDAGKLAIEIGALVQKAEGVFRGYGVWKFGPQYETDRSKQLAEARAAVSQIRAENIKRALKLLWANMRR